MYKGSIEISTNVIEIQTTYQPYLLDTQDIQIHQIHQLPHPMIETWIDSGITLQEQFSFLDHHDHVV